MAETDPLGKNWKLWGGILAFITVLIIVGLIFFPRSSAEPETAPTAPAPSVPAETTEASSSPTASKPVSGDCPSLSTDNSFPNDAPETEWKRHPAGMLLPVSSEHGPAKQDGEFWRCFSHTPTGAVLAGFTLVIDFSAGGQKNAAAESPNRDELFAEQNALSGKDFPPMLGYRVMNSSDESAIVEYLSKSGEKYGAMSVDLTWSDDDNDWRLDLSSSEPTWSVVNDPSSYTEFK